MLSLIPLFRGVRAAFQLNQHCFWRQPLQFSPQNLARAFVSVLLRDVLGLRFAAFVIQLIGSTIGVVLLISHFIFLSHQVL